MTIPTRDELIGVVRREHERLGASNERFHGAVVDALLAVLPDLAKLADTRRALDDDIRLEAFIRQSERDRARIAELEAELAAEIDRASKLEAGWRASIEARTGVALLSPPGDGGGGNG